MITFGPSPMVIGCNHYNPQGEVIDFSVKAKEKLENGPCDVCGKEENTKACSRCRKAFYCSVECQKKDWVSGHKSVCKPN